MKFLRNILGRHVEEPDLPAEPEETGPDPVLAALAELEIKRLREALAATNPAATNPDRTVLAAESEAEPGSAARPSRVVRTKAPLPEGVRAPAVNIWDLEDGDEPASGSTGLAATDADVLARSWARVQGLDSAPGGNVSLFETPAFAPAERPVSGQKFVMFPVGWLVVKSGPGQGSTFSLASGVSQIGRGTDQTVPLDFGDMTISRQNHAAIAYDSLTHQFHIGHGGKTNLVRLNGKPLLSTETMLDGDQVQIGETTLMLKVLCTPAFNWAEVEAGGDGHDMAIA